MSNNQERTTPPGIDVVQANVSIEERMMMLRFMLRPTGACHHDRLEIESVGGPVVLAVTHVMPDNTTLDSEQ